ncbi:hypothetical protein GCM10010112_26720 [Actinoplanes lobatus]|uniref:Uncharacterized protein n=1 Tax=Actinoplanes lobatus TaxID=113568 RepID=A0A7W7MIS4_9ACTN|nr:hypothetical protein [Actinoplanes lobatus]MBB4751713.1 hypothetical protein [Actinoplanes lobatus]GGN65393.1 hypothetical protein GCM10010112_26720 [Actinoplanes lobatus]GIE43296.1 hypothetical protein Alo02nite_61940 [Actinoplanes lobatus]
MREDHPVDRLVVALEGDATASMVQVMRASAQRFADRRAWVLGPPSFLDRSDEPGDRWVGFGLRIYTALPPWGDEIDPQVDRAHLEEVKELVAEICRISEEHCASFQVEYAGEFIGMVESGRMDSGLADNLIGEWERVIDAARSAE